MALPEGQLDSGPTRTQNAPVDFRATAVEDANLGTRLQPQDLDQVP